MPRLRRSIAASRISRNPSPTFTSATDNQSRGAAKDGIGHRFPQDVLCGAGVSPARFHCHRRCAAGTTAPQVRHKAPERQRRDIWLANLGLTPQANHLSRLRRSGVTCCRRVLQGAPERTPSSNGIRRFNDPLAGPEGPAYSSYDLVLMSRGAAKDGIGHRFPQDVLCGAGVSPARFHCHRRCAAGTTAPQVRHRCSRAPEARQMVSLGREPQGYRPPPNSEPRRGDRF